MEEDGAGWIDLGDGHEMAFTRWAPDRRLNPQYTDLPDDDRVGALVRHRKPDGSPCEGGIFFDCEAARRAFGGRPLWRVACWNPLTVTPSLLCSCGDHGFITRGRWVRA